MAQAGMDTPQTLSQTHKSVDVHEDISGTALKHEGIAAWEDGGNLSMRLIRLFDMFVYSLSTPTPNIYGTCTFIATRHKQVCNILK